jgi:hypothetical protein
MTRVYKISSGGIPEALAPVRSRNEDHDLQALLEKNYNLLPGDQIDPDDPCRWLLIKREMPVPDPSTGSDRWSIDFFFADHRGIPTFVECKRFADTRARREIVGQMLEYAANGHRYWGKDLIRELAGHTAAQGGTTLEQAVEKLRIDDEMTIDTFFERIEENLREGQLRIIFFLDQAPIELRSVIDFLNRQMERSEVLLVEARQFRDGQSRIVVPSLFGYTEQARLVKRSIIITNRGARRHWDRESFLADSKNKLAQNEFAAVTGLLDGASKLGCQITWGTGKLNGSYNIKHQDLARRSLYTVYSNGELWFNFGWLNEDPREEQVATRFKDLVVEQFGLTIADDRLPTHVPIAGSEWTMKADVLLQILEQLLEEFHDESA